MIDTIQIAKNLTASGLPVKQAEAIAQALLAIPESAELATKSDLKAAIAGLRADLIYWIVGSVGISTLAQIAVSVARK